MIKALIIGTKKTQTLLLPSNWDEVTKEQLLQITEIIYRYQDDPTICMVHIVKSLTGVKNGLLYRTRPEIIHENLFAAFDWIKKEPHTRQLIPMIRCGWKKLYGPSDRLDNIRFAEFDFAERDLYEWHQDPDEPMHLYRFVACLYRLRKKGNDPGDREPFNYGQAQARAKQLSKQLPFKYALAIMFWYKGCRKQFAEMYPQIFPKPEPGSGGVEEIPSYFGLMRSIAKSSIYGRFEDVENMFLHNAMVEMTLLIQEKEALEAIREAKTELTEEV